VKDQKGKDVKFQIYARDGYTQAPGGVGQVTGDRSQVTGDRSQETDQELQVVILSGSEGPAFGGEYRPHLTVPKTCHL